MSVPRGPRKEAVVRFKGDTVPQEFERSVPGSFSERRRVVGWLYVHEFERARHGQGDAPGRGLTHPGTPGTHFRWSHITGQQCAHQP